MIIYKITNKINGKVYIGQTINSLKTRWKQHCFKSSVNCRLLHRAIMKYGKENFTVEQIDIAIDRNELDLKEQYWIKFYDSINPNKGYNLTSGGGHCEFSEETKLKISNSLKNSIVFKTTSKSEEYRKKLSESAKGRKHTDETKKKISIANKGRKVWATGKHFSEEHRKKLSEAQKGEKHHNSRKIICIETGEIYVCLREAGEKLNIKNTSNICSCCKGKLKTAGGYHWRYVDEK